MADLTLNSLGVHLKVADIAASRTFYESLGFKPIFGYGDDAFRASLPEGCGSAPERYCGVTYQLGDGSTFEIASGHIAVKPEVFKERVASPKVSAMIKVASLVPLLTNKNVPVTFPVRHYYWGSIEAAVRDPDGFVLVFIAPYSGQEMTAVQKLVNVETVQPGEEI